MGFKFLFYTSAIMCAILLGGWQSALATTEPDHSGPNDGLKAGGPAGEKSTGVAAKAEASRNAAGTFSDDHQPSSNPSARPDTIQKKKTPGTPATDPNRRWIMRQQDHTKKKLKPVQRKPLKWAGKDQQASCRTYERRMAETFDQARYYSIQGDRCKTAQFARAFLDTSGQCKTECPSGFLDYNGYSETVLRNMYQLKAIGTESCLGSKSSSSSSATNKMIQKSSVHHKATSK